jgi:hypothetical protein
VTHKSGAAAVMCVMVVELFLSVLVLSTILLACHKMTVCLLSGGSFGR